MIAVVLALLAGCAGGSTSQAADSTPSGLADVVAVTVTGDAGSYDFAVSVRSPDTGCQQYAQFWEVIAADGSALHYRRILMHSHVDEQPFSRSGGPIKITADQDVLVRAYMKPDGYGGQAMSGTVAGGFEVASVAADFATALKADGPQIEDCSF